MTLSLLKESRMRNRTEDRYNLGVQYHLIGKGPNLFHAVQLLQFILKFTIFHQREHNNEISRIPAVSS